MEPHLKHIFTAVKAQLLAAADSIQVDRPMKLKCKEQSASCVNLAHDLQRTCLVRWPLSYGNRQPIALHWYGLFDVTDFFVLLHWMVENVFCELHWLSCCDEVSFCIRLQCKDDLLRETFSTVRSGRSMTRFFALVSTSLQCRGRHQSAGFYV